MGETDELARNIASALRIFKNTVGDLPPEQMGTKAGREATRSLIVNAIREISEGGMMLLENDFDELLVYATKRRPYEAAFKEMKGSLANELPLVVDEKRVERAEITIERILNGVASDIGAPRNERDMAIAHALIEKGERNMEYIRRAAQAIEARTNGFTPALSYIDEEFGRKFKKQLGIMGQDEFVDPREERKAQIREQVKKIVNDCEFLRGMTVPRDASEEGVRELKTNETDNRILKMLLDAGETDTGLVREAFQGNHAVIWSPEREYLNADLKPETFWERFDRDSQKNRETAKAEVDRAKKQSPEWKAAKIKQSERIRDWKVKKIDAQIRNLEKERKTANPERQQEIDSLLPVLTSKKFSINLWQMGYAGRLLSAETIQKVEAALGKDWKKKILIELATGFFQQGDVNRLSAREINDNEALGLLTVIESTVKKVKERVGADESVEERETKLANKSYWEGVNLAAVVGNAPFSDQFGRKLIGMRATGFDSTLKDRDGMTKGREALKMGKRTV